MEGEIDVMGSFTAKAGTNVLDHATIEAEASRLHESGWQGQIVLHALEDVRHLRRRDEGTQHQGIGEDVQRPSKTDAIGLEGMSVRRPHAQRMDSIMGQQQGMQFLQDQQRQVTAQGLLAETLMIFQFIDHQFNFPAFMIQQTHFQRGRLERIQQSGEQAMFLPDLRIAIAAVRGHTRGGLSRHHRHQGLPFWLLSSWLFLKYARNEAPFQRILTVLPLVVVLFPLATAPISLA